MHVKRRQATFVGALNELKHAAGVRFPFPDLADGESFIFVCEGGGTVAIFLCNSRCSLIVPFIFISINLCCVLIIWSLLPSLPAEKIQKRWGDLSGEVVRVDLDRSVSTISSLGLSLAGHKDRQVMAVFICGLNPNGKRIITGNSSRPECGSWTCLMTNSDNQASPTRTVDYKWETNCWKSTATSFTDDVI